MNPADKITALEEKRGALESQLLVVGISEAREVAIRQQIFGIDGQITVFASKLQVQVAPDERPVWRRELDQMYEPAGFVIAVSSVLFSMMVIFTRVRHAYHPYVASQYKWRQMVFFLDEPNASFPLGVRKVAFVSSFLLYVRGYFGKKE